MRRTAILLLTALLLSGCWSQREVNNISLVTSLGVDITPRGQIQVIMAVTHPFTGGGGQSSGEGAAGSYGRVVLIREGPTVAEAISSAGMAVPRELNLTHIQLIVLGERLSRRGLDAVIDYLVRLPQMRMTTHVAVLRGAPIQRLLGLPPIMDAIQGHAIREAQRKRIAIEMRLVDFVIAGVSGYQSPIAPVITLRPHPAREPQAPPQEPELAGAAVFRNGRLAAVFDQRQARGAMWLRGEVRDAIVTGACPGRPDKRFSARVRRPRVQVRLQGQSAQPAFRVRVRGYFHLIDMQCPLDPSQPETLQRLQAVMQRDILDRVAATIRRAQAIPADPFYFGETVRAMRPALWRQIGKRWPEVWARTPVEVEVDAHLTHTEVLNRSLSFTESDAAGW